MLRCPALVIAFFLLSGCQHVPRYAECQTHHGTPWRELTSQHFRLTTNLDSEAAKATLIELERTRRMLLYSAWRDAVDPQGRIDAFVLQSHEQLNEFADEDVAGFVARNERGLAIVLGGQSYTFHASPARRLVMHEMAHYINSYVLLRQPRWIAEGLAEYLETTRPYGDGSQVQVGALDPALVRLVKAHTRIPLEALWAWDRLSLHGTEQQLYYATSGLWVHFLLNQHPAEFSDFQFRLGRAEEPRLAWNESFQGFSSDELQRELNQYLRYGFYYVARLKMPDVSVATSERGLSDGEVHAVRVRLMMLGGREAEDTWSAVEEEMKRAMELDPNNFQVQLIRFIGKSREEHLELARELVERFPREADAWLILAYSLPKSAESERRAALIQALHEEPDNVHVLNNLAWHYVTSGQPKVAIPLAQKAVTLAPWSAAFIDTYAAALAGAGGCAEAIAAQRRAFDLLHESAPAKERIEIEARLAKYELACKP